MTTNLTLLSASPSARTGPQKTNKQAHQREFLEKIVKKGIYKFADPSLADRAINGFRRSRDDAEASEEDFLKTDLPKFEVKRDYHYRRALRVCREIFQPKEKLQPVALNDQRYYPWKLATSAEQPYTISGAIKLLLRELVADGTNLDDRPTFHNLYNKIFVDNLAHVHHIKRCHAPFFVDGVPQPYYKIAMHARSHLVASDEEDKIRAVFGVPKLLLMVENMFTWPLQKTYLNQEILSPMLWNYETFRGGWNKLANRLSTKKFRSVLGADWSKFDKRMLHEMIDDVHDIWRSYFDFENGWQPTSFYPNSRTSPEKLENLWHWMCENIKHYPLQAPSGRTYQWKFNGFASGFMQTQLMDSFVNTIMILTCLSALGVNIESKDFEILVQGDDSLVVFAEQFFQIYGPTFLDKLAAEALSRFNAILNVKKSSFSDSLEGVDVLRYKNVHNRAVRDEAELLAHLLYPEHPRTLEALAASAIGIAQANQGNSRTVYLICKDVYDFLTSKLGREPDFRYIDQDRGRWNAPLVPRYFPSFDETWSQNYIYSGRTELDKERLWPTLKESANGFFFLKN